MQYAPQSTPQQSANTVHGFCSFSAPQLRELAERLGIHISEQGLSVCQQYFRLTEMRDPTAEELILLDSYAAHFFGAGVENTLLEIQTKDPESTRIHQDICRMRTALFARETTLTLPDIMDTCNEYLDRAGRTPLQDRLFCGSKAEVTAKVHGARPTLRLDLPAASAVIKAPLATRRRTTPERPLIALDLSKMPREDDGTARFLDAFAAIPLQTVAVIGEEGLLPHLTAIPRGIALDAQALGAFDAKTDAFSPAALCRNTVLFAAPPHAVAELLASEYPVRVIGKLLASDRINVYWGNSQLISLHRPFLKRWQVQRTRSVAVLTATGTADAISLTGDSTDLLAGITTATGDLSPLLALIKESLAAGADPERATLGAVLSLPYGNEAALSGALSLLFSYHRFTAELALPTACHRIIAIPAHTEPSLTVFLAARRAAAPTPQEMEALDRAIGEQDFAAIRRILYATA